MLSINYLLTELLFGSQTTVSSIFPSPLKNYNREATIFKIVHFQVHGEQEGPLECVRRDLVTGPGVLVQLLHSLAIIFSGRWKMP